jgi:hypothetical protein
MGGSGENAERFILPQLTWQGEGQMMSWSPTVLS